MASLNDLFAVAPKQFTAARKALVKKLRASGQDAEADRAAALRRPTAALWVVNQLARVARADVEALIDAAAQLRRAYAKGSGESLREAMSAQHAAVAAIARAAEKAARELGAKPSADLLRRVQDTAQTAAAVEPDALRTGTLEAELAPAGFDALAGTQVAAPRRPRAPKKAATKKAQRPSRNDRAAEKAARAEQQRRERELRAAEHEVNRLRQLAERAEAAAEKARAAADDAQARLRDAEAHARALRGPR